MREAGRAWTPLVPSHATATNGAQLDRRRRRQRAGERTESAGHHLHRRRPRTTATGITGLRLEALLDPSLPKQGPGRDPYGHFRVTSLRCSRRRSNDPAKRTPSTFAEVKGDGNVVRGDLVELTKEGPATYARRGKAWVTDAVREGWRVPFQLVLVPRAPVGFPGGTVFTVEIGHEDGTLGQGLGRFRLSTTDAKAPAAGRGRQRAHARGHRRAAGRAHRGTGQGPGDAVPGPVAVVRGRARRKSRASRRRSTP